MPKAYLVVCYHKVTDPAKLAAYGKLVDPALQAAGGHFLARGVAVHAYEAGQLDWTVVAEFESAEKAAAFYHSAAYQKALKALDGGAIRDMRIVPVV